MDHSPKVNRDVEGFKHSSIAIPQFVVVIGQRAKRIALASRQVLRLSFIVPPRDKNPRRRERAGAARVRES